ncbi:MAG: 4-oxalocrotonate tautomerase [Paraburkholderia sp.]|uniref:tautomerase family protein n=1 Tax=Paraburkholderia sp. TaxID=1926495 RepID=UPI00121BFC61|nr:tautomerase family protein [Paraburkholderia sp.]TAM06494.1 MAG: 4-oxalocrotonate tautomerase [Paraburkholderia sp.]TAM29084.1 MAG: 4-oxalocrotonate tautomerase [Paraburkholderia sp.]
MPHVIVKMWPGKSEQQKQELSDEITQAVTGILGYGKASVSVGIEIVQPSVWVREVYDPDIRDRWNTLYQKPGYDPSDL